ncbi:MAG TPA: flagellar motor protein MotB [Terriglobales bacterium]|nr:flagellar motor protein MotB [Terriglobales bacterium]
MRRRRRTRIHHSHDRWLVSYADFITLLFAFFVVMYSTAQVDQRKVGKLAMAIQVAFQEMGVFPTSATQIPVSSKEPMPFNSVQAIENIRRNTELGRIVSPPEAELSSSAQNENLAGLRRQLEKTLAPEIQRHEVALRTVPDGLVISLREIGFFDSGSANIKAGSLPAFARIADLLLQGSYRIRIEGHTDNVPIHNGQFPSNWELSTARASELVRLLVVKYGFAPERLAAAGYAQYHPVASNATADGRAQNRRVDIVVLGKMAEETPPPAQAAPPESAKPSPAVPYPIPR